MSCMNLIVPSSIKFSHNLDIKHKTLEYWVIIPEAISVVNHMVGCSLQG